jgi:hypothetical protein
MSSAKNPSPLAGEGEGEGVSDDISREGLAF